MHAQAAARAKVHEISEEILDLTADLYVEFTGLISWHAGSGLGWHTDDNRWEQGSGQGLQGPGQAASAYQQQQPNPC